MANLPNILVVEDEVRLARTIELYQGQRGYVGRTASHGEAARNTRPDSISITGKVAGTGLVDPVPILELRERTGALGLKRDGDSGTIYLQDGKIIGADPGTAQGPEPLASLLAWESGDYCC